MCLHKYLMFSKCDILDNCNKEDHRKLCLHLLHRLGLKRTLRYSKVTIKQTSKVLKDCYSTREWLERRKRKALVKKELHKLNSNLGLMDGGRCLQEDRWKQFKVDYNVISFQACSIGSSRRGLLCCSEAGLKQEQGH